MSPSPFSPADPKGSYRNVYPLLPCVITESPPAVSHSLSSPGENLMAEEFAKSPELCLEQRELRAASACAAPAWQHPHRTAWADGIRWSKIPSCKRLSPVQIRHGAGSELWKSADFPRKHHSISMNDRTCAHCSGVTQPKSRAKVGCENWN